MWRASVAFPRRWPAPSIRWPAAALSEPGRQPREDQLAAHVGDANGTPLLGVRDRLPSSSAEEAYYYARLAVALRCGFGGPLL